VYVSTIFFILKQGYMFRLKVSHLQALTKFSVTRCFTHFSVYSYDVITCISQFSIFQFTNRPILATDLGSIVNDVKLLISCLQNVFFFISVFNQLDTQNLFHNKFYFMPLHVSSTCAHHQEVKIALHRIWYHHTETSDWSKITKNTIL